MPKQFQRGPWTVVTPIFSSEKPTQEEMDRFITCPHPSWEIAQSGPVVDEKNELVIDPEIGEPVFNVVERCPICGGVRFRYIPLRLKDEPFDYSIPTKEPWYERLYNLGNFSVLSRRLLPPDETIDYMTRVDTPSGASFHTYFSDTKTQYFSPSVLGLLAILNDVARVGPEQYAAFKILKEGHKTKQAKQRMRERAETLGRIVSEIGPESLASAQAIMEAEPENEAADMEEWEIGQMEREAQLRREQLQKRRQKPK